MGFPPAALARLKSIGKPTVADRQKFAEQGRVLLQRLTEPEDLAKQIVASIRAVVVGKHRKAQDIRNIARSAKTMRVAPGESAANVRNLFLRLKRMRWTDIEALLPYLDSLDAALPFEEKLQVDGAADPAHVENLHALKDVALEAGDLQGLLGPQPEVERWIETYADQLMATIEPQSKKNGHFGRQLAEAYIAADMISREHLTLLGECYKNIGSYGFLAAELSEIRRAIMVTVLTKISKSCDQREETEFSETVDAFEDRIIHPEYLPAASEFDWARNIYPGMQKAREDLIRVDAAFAQQSLIPEMIDFLAEFSSSKSEHGHDLPRVLPQGTFSMGRLYGETAVFYTVDGLLRHSNIAVRQSSKDTSAVRVIRSQLTRNSGVEFAFKNVTSCFIDDVGKPYGEWGTDRLAPSQTDPDKAGVLQRADRILNEELQKLWIDQPELFAELMNISPILYFRDGQTDRLFCSEKFSGKVMSILQKPPEQSDITQQELKKHGIESTGNWTSFLMHQVVPAVSAPAQSARTSNGRDYWRAKIHEEMGDRLPSFNWVVESLSNVGKVWETPAKGSHATLHLRRYQRETRCPIIPNFRTTDSFPYWALYKILRLLDVSEQEFYEKCIKKA